MDLIKYFNLLR